MKPTYDRGCREAGSGAPDVYPVGPVHLRGGCGTLPEYRTISRFGRSPGGCGGPRPEVSLLIEHNLHSVRVGENLCRPHRYAVRSNQELSYTWPLRGEGRGCNPAAARRNLTPNVLSLLGGCRS